VPRKIKENKRHVDNGKKEKSTLALRKSTLTLLYKRRE
jgi:hypothetical protein